MSAVSGHLLYCVRSLWSSPVLCPQSISCTVSAVSGHLLYYVRSLVSSCTVSAFSGHLLYYVCSPLVQNFFSFPPLKSRCVLWSGASYGAKNMVIIQCKLTHPSMSPCFI
ncbi:unnamed protein product, partial [Staurois parvus]